MSLSSGCGVPLKSWTWGCSSGFKSLPGRPCGWVRFQRRPVLLVRAVDTVEDCNEEGCAPAKEVGKLSGEWLAEEKTKVIGTYPPLSRQSKVWTGYVEKDTAGQTNIYSVEPTVYVAESAYSSGAAGSSAEGSENNLAIATGLGLIAVASASSILLAVGKSGPTESQMITYAGPPLSYYIQKFTPSITVEATAAPVVDRVVVSASFINTEAVNSTDFTNTEAATITNAPDLVEAGPEVPEALPSTINGELEIPAEN